MNKTILALTLSLLSSASFASTLVSQDVVDDALSIIPGITQEHIVFAKHDAKTDMNIVRLVNGQVVYVDKDSEFFIDGGVYHNSVIVAKDSKTGQHYNHAADLYNDLHKSIFDAIDGYGVIAKAPNEKMSMKVFYEPRCGYCKKLHSEQQSYLDAGISIEYIPFPIYDGERQSSSKSLAYIVSAKTQEERNERMNVILKAFEKDPKNPDIANLIKDVDVSVLDKHAKEISSLAIQGTPFILLDNGKTIPGYAPAASILEAGK